MSARAPDSIGAPERAPGPIGAQARAPDSIGAPERAPWVLLALAAAAALAHAAWRLFTATEADVLARVTCDDSYYFFQIARNLARGLGPTFDGRDPTDGFRPVWGFALVPIHALVADPALAARACCLLGVACHVAGLAILARVLAPIAGAGASAIACAAAMVAPALGAQAASGMDWPANALLEALALAAVARAAAAPRPSAAGTRALLVAGAVLGLNLIERPETAPLFALLALPWIARRDPRGLGLLALGVAAVALPFYAWSWSQFGSLLPVAGRIKGNFALHELTAGRFGEALARIGELPAADLLTAFGPPSAANAYAIPPAARWSLLAALIGMAAVGVRSLRRGPPGAPGAIGRRMPAPGAADATRRGQPAPGALAAALGFALVHALFVAALLHPYLEYGRWYLAPQDLAAVAMLAFALRGAAQFLGARASVAGALLAVLALASSTALRWRAEQQAPPASPTCMEARALDVAAWLRERLPAGRCAGVFNAGRIGYYADNRVINLDGLVNTHAFAERVWTSSDPDAPRVELLRYVVEQRIEILLDVWERSLEGRLPAVYFGVPALEPAFALEQSWPFDSPYTTILDGSYQAYRVDLDAVAELLARMR